jgi:hypothetical protein
MPHISTQTIDRSAHDIAYDIVDIAERMQRRDRTTLFDKTLMSICTQLFLNVKDEDEDEDEDEDGYEKNVTLIAHVWLRDPKTVAYIINNKGWTVPHERLDEESIYAKAVLMDREHFEEDPLRMFCGAPEFICYERPWIEVSCVKLINTGSAVVPYSCRVMGDATFLWGVHPGRVSEVIRAAWQQVVSDAVSFV